MTTFSKRMPGSSRGWALFATLLGYERGENGYGVPTFRGNGPSFPLTPWFEWNRGQGRALVWVRLEFKWADRWWGMYHRFQNYGGGSGQRKGGDVNVDIWLVALPTLPLHLQVHETGGHSQGRFRWVRKHPYRGAKDASPIPFPARTPRQRLDRLWYLARFWSPRWSFICTMRGGVPTQDIDWTNLREWFVGLQVWPAVLLKGRETWR